MSEHTAAPAPDDAAPNPTAAVPVTGWHRVVAWTLLLAMAASVVATGVLGSRIATPRELVQALEAGEVELLEVEGDVARMSAADDPERMGSWLLTVRWRDGLLAEQTELVRLSPAVVEALASSGPGFDELDGEDVQRWNDQPEAFSDEQFSTDPLAAIMSLTPEDGLLLADFTASDARLGDWFTAPFWVVATYWFAVLLAITSLVAGPAPQWMTRWGWFWVMGGVPAVGVLAYALLGAHGAPGPRSRGSYRMPGLAGFALAAVVTLLSGLLYEVLRRL